ncbi:MAG TPA: ECF-type sigma factor [Vicinamibacterales bacterium]|jgi:RNA polymerase sigma factor (TIGR02999 family)
MAHPASGEITALLHRWGAGDEDALDQLFPIVYEELRRLAAYYVGMEAPSATLQATSLVHDAYLRLVKDSDRDWAGRAHFFAVASRIIRHLLVDHAREIRAQKRGGGADRVSLDAAGDVAAPDVLELLELDEALTALRELDPVKARIVEMRFFGGLSVAETSAVLKIAPATVKRHFAVAKLWLHRRLRGNVGQPPGDDVDDVRSLE